MAPIYLGLFYSTYLHCNETVDFRWLKLLHYQKGLISNYQSDSIDPNFFLSPKGRFDPILELHAAKREIIRSDLAGDAHFLCRFPARSELLKEMFPDLKVPQMECPELSKFKQRLSGSSATVVYSAAYMNNPSSSYGHTFIRIGRDLSQQADSKDLELLDTGINYGAATGDAGPFLYFFGGIFGYFSGTFTAIPYYYKVAEYNNFESRDLWSYHLDLTPKEIQMLILHIWELGHTYFRYYFFTQNCSYHVLSMLEAVRPSLNLIDRLPALYVIPLETVRIIDQAKLIKRITYRPSAESQLSKELLNLDHNLIKQFNRILNNEEIDSNLTSKQKIAIFDSAIAYYDFKYAKEIIKGDAELVQKKRQILAKRATITEPSPVLNFDDKKSEFPHLSHPSNRLMTTVDNKNQLELEWRYSYHDFLDNSFAHQENMRLEIAKIAVKRSENNKYKLKDLTIFESFTVGNCSSLICKPTWKILGGEWLTNINGREYETIGAKAGYGPGLQRGIFALYLLPQIETSYIVSTLQKYRLRFTIETGAIINLSKELKFASEFQFLGSNLRDHLLSNRLRWSSTIFGIGLIHQYDDTTYENRLGGELLSYF